MSIRKTVIRALVDIDEVNTPFVVASEGQAGGSVPYIWQAVGVEFQIAFARHGELITDIANLVSVTLRVLAKERTGAAYMEQTILAAAMDGTVTAATWADGSKQHLSFSFTGAETNLAATLSGTEYFLELSGYTSDDETDPDCFGWTQLFVVLRGATNLAPVQAGNIIPVGAEYDVNGDYALTVVAAAWYHWTAGDSDISATNGTETITTSGANFVTQSTTITLHGTPEATVTAVVRKSPSLTADDIYALVSSLLGGAITMKHGVHVLVEGDELVTVDISAFGFGSSPAVVFPYLIKPLGGDKLTCELIDGSVTATQFQVEVSPVPGSGYKVGYILIQ